MLKIYLDNCCYNRPFDNQKDAAIAIETQAKCDYLITTDKRLLKYSDKRIRLVNPVEFVRIWETL